MPESVMTKKGKKWSGLKHSGMIRHQMGSRLLFTLMWRFFHRGCSGVDRQSRIGDMCVWSSICSVRSFTTPKIAGAGAGAGISAQSRLQSPEEYSLILRIFRQLCIVCRDQIHRQGI